MKEEDDIVGSLWYNDGSVMPHARGVLLITGKKYFPKFNDFTYSYVWYIEGEMRFDVEAANSDRDEKNKLCNAGWRLQ